MVQSGIPIIWVMGGPGCGKGTQCKKIVAKYQFVSFSTGDLLRDEVASGSELGKQVEEIMSKGDLVPDEIVLNLLSAAIEKVPGAPGFVIDGYPRTPAQGPAFEKLIAPVDIMIYLECSDATLLERLMNRASENPGERPDDEEEVMKARIATFRETIDEILGLYPTKLKRINGEPLPDIIFADIVKAIDAVLATKKSAK